MKKALKKRLMATFVFSVISSMALIIHGIFFDLDFGQLRRLTIEGFLFTFILVFLGLIILEWIFNIEDHDEFQKLKTKIKRLEDKKFK